jgi:hypothetical protein
MVCVIGFGECRDIPKCLPRHEYTLEFLDVVVERFDEGSERRQFELKVARSMKGANAVSSS